MAVCVSGTLACVWLSCHMNMQFKLTMILVLCFKVFKNHGASAGASLSHSHSQIMALPIIPPFVSARLDGTKEYFDKTGKCSLCEVQVGELLINQSAHFIAIVPFAATFPFEIWIVPRNHSSHFHELDCEKVIITAWFYFPQITSFN